LKPNVQFDPGKLGGWGRVFTVNEVQAAVQGSSPQFNYVISDTVQDTSYYVTLTATDYDRPWTQFSDYAQGTYTTTQNKNWYAAENNTWDSVYYDTIFTSTVGPEKLSPVELCSPYVATSPLERQDLVEDTYQGAYAADAFAAAYPDETYFRGATNPYTEYGAQDTYDDDDSSESLGICTKTTDGPVSTFLTGAIGPSSVIQISQQPDQTLNQRYRPEIIQFSVLSPIDLVNPKQAVSVVSLSIAPIVGKEYLRVIGLNGNVVTAIRLNSENSLYPNPPSTSQAWPAGTTVTACFTSTTPSIRAYDPNWSSTKRAVLRFFEVMGYPQTATLPLLTPRFWGERFIPVNFLPISPASDGYAAVTGEWPLQFNNSSTIFANTHTWAYCGYYNYSRGLPDYQTNNFSRKLSYDYLSTTLWSGALTITGVTESGDVVQLGNLREGLTSQFYQQPVPTVQLVNQEIYETPAISEFPAQVVVYSADDISGLFDGLETTFNLTTSGVLIPPEQLTTLSTLVSLGAVTQIPADSYTIAGSKIVFSVAPKSGTVCDIRILTSEDQEKTLIAYSFTLSPAFDGVTSIFTATTATTATDRTDITDRNLFVFLGGVEQVPIDAYYLTRINSNTIEIYFTEAPDPGTTIDVRCFTTGEYWTNRLIFPVEVYSLDDISVSFNNAQKTFQLTAGGLPVNPAVVNTENLFVSLGGAIQIPTTSYSVSGSQITFTGAPAPGTTSNLRIITNAEFLTCPSENDNGDILRWGPGLILSLANALEGLDSGGFG
jgi:hypothetical protein